VSAVGDFRREIDRRPSTGLILISIEKARIVRRRKNIARFRIVPGLLDPGNVLRTCRLPVYRIADDVNAHDRALTVDAVQHKVFVPAAQSAVHVKDAMQAKLNDASRRLLVTLCYLRYDGGRVRGNAHPVTLRVENDPIRDEGAVAVVAYQGDSLALIRRRAGWIDHGAVL
jgi:hypothetical protein